MARIQTYDSDIEITGTEKVIGSDSDNTTKNYALSDIAAYVGGLIDVDTPFTSNNTIRTFNTIIATESGKAAAVVAFNATPYLDVSPTEIINVAVQRLETRQTGTKTNEVFLLDYYWLTSGKGTYGTGGTNTIVAGDLLYRGTNEVLSVETISNLPPVVYEVAYEDIDTNTIVNFVNASATSFLIDANADYFFNVIEIISGIGGIEYTGKKQYYRFVGANGTYGLGLTQTVNGDFVLLSQNDTTEPIPQTYLGLEDTFDRSYDGKVGYTPIVTQNPVIRNDYYLELKPALTLADIYRSNTPIDYGVSLSPNGGLSYDVFCNRAVINQVDYLIPTSDTVTLSNGDVTNPRIDLIILRLNPNLREATIVVLEGTADGLMVEESVDLQYEVVLSRRIVLANETTDPKATSDMIYNENVEWTNTALPTGGALNDVVDPFNGTLSLSLLSAGTTADITTWDKGSTVDFDINKNLVFAIKEPSSDEVGTEFEFIYTNTANGGEFYFKVTLANLIKYGYVSTDNDWQVINIPHSNFNSSSKSNTQFNTFTISVKNSNALSFDWIQIAGGVTVVPKSSALGYEGYSETGTQAGDDLGITVGDTTLTRTNWDIPNTIVKTHLPDATGFFDIVSIENPTNKLRFFSYLDGATGGLKGPLETNWYDTGIQFLNPAGEAYAGVNNAIIGWTDDTNFTIESGYDLRLYSNLRVDIAAYTGTVRGADLVFRSDRIITSMTVAEVDTAYGNDTINSFQLATCAWVIANSDLPVLEVIEGTGVTVDSSDSQRPIVSITGQTLKTKEVSITAAQIETLNSSPVVLFPTVSGTIISINQVILVFNWGSVAFDNSDLFFEYGAGSGESSIFINNILNDTANGTALLSNSNDVYLSGDPNVDLVLTADSDSTTTGDSTIDLYISYYETIIDGGGI